MLVEPRFAGSELDSLAVGLPLEPSLGVVELVGAESSRGLIDRLR